MVNTDSGGGETLSESDGNEEELFDSYPDKYTNTVNDAISFTGLGVDFFTRVKAAYIADLCNAHFEDVTSVRALDIGCGVGNFHGLLNPLFGELYGVDVSRRSIEKAIQDHPGVHYQSYDGLRLPFEDDSFDLVYSICVMHHVPPHQWQNFVREMKRVLRKGGLVLVFEHNPRNPLTMRAVNNCEFDDDAVLLPGGTIVSMFEDAGFASIKEQFILSLPAASRILRILDSWVSRLGLGAQYYVSASKD